MIEIPVVSKWECLITVQGYNFVGNLGEYKVDGFGEKFIGVASGGVLEIHGEYRLPWTKLTSNVNAVEYISNVKVSGRIFQHYKINPKVSMTKFIIIG